MPVNKPAPIVGLTRAGTIGVVAVCIATFAILILAATRQPFASADRGNADRGDIVRAPSQPQAATVASTARKAPAGGEASRREATADAPVVAAVATASAAQPAERAVAREAAPGAFVTMAGCLEDDGGTYRLKSVSGANAPKSRSWKSAFLKKGSASIEVIDAANRLKLPTYVGHRVQITGVLEDREMRARALQRIGEPCD